MPGTWPRLYAILDVEVCARFERDPFDVGRAFLSAGVRCLQLRAKPWGSGRFLDFTNTLMPLVREADALLIVNDRADIAAMAGAAGVHVGQDDLTPADARQVLGETAIVGLSTHTEAQWQEGLGLPVSYLAVGPVFGTGTKETGYEAIGLGTVRRAALATAPAGIPLVAIGGITLERAPSVIASGAASVAVIGDLMTGDPEARARQFLRALE